MNQTPHRPTPRIVPPSAHRTAPRTMRLRSRRIVTPEGVVDGVLILEDGKIAAIKTGSGAGNVEDLGDLVVLPGGIDPHVHLNEPGRTDWEGFESGTRAAAAGGLTTLTDMPLNSAPTTTSLEALETKIEAALQRREQGRLHAELLFHGGLVPGNFDDLEPLIAAGVAGIKAFLAPSGIDDFGHVGEAELRPAMKLLARLGVPLLAHAETVSPIAAVGDPNAYSTWLASRPDGFELEAIDLLIRLTRETGCVTHIVHLATAEALPGLRKARGEGLPISVETCPHYLLFAAEDLPDADPRFKCAPPIRTARHREALWGALRAGDVDLIASDHSPSPPSMKSGNLLDAWGGISSLEVGATAAWSEALRREWSFTDFVRKTSAAPARLLGLGERKGAIVAGFDADLAIYDPAKTWTVRGEELRHRHPQTAYEDRALQGGIVRTICGGRTTFDAARIERLNRISDEALRSDLEACCGARRWADRMLAGRPYQDLGDLFRAAENAAADLQRSDWLEAFSHHPRIGDVEALRERFGARSGNWSKGEQSGLADVEESTLRRLAEGNRAYEERFGYLFIVCASGKSAAEMLSLLEARLDNDPADEIFSAAREQRRITRLRLDKLLETI